MMHFTYLNGIPVQLGSPLPSSIYSLQVVVPPLPVAFPLEQVPQLKAWLNDLVDRLTCDYFTYNGVLIPTDDITKF